MLHVDYIRESMSEEMKEMVFGESVISEALGKNPEVALAGDGSEEFVINEEKPEEDPESVQEGWLQKIMGNIADAGYGSANPPIGLGAYSNPNKAVKKAAEDFIQMAFKELEPALKNVVVKYPEFKKAITIAVDDYSLQNYLRSKTGVVFFVKFDIDKLRKFNGNMAVKAKFDEMKRLLQATIVTSSYGTRYMSSEYDNDFSILFAPRPSLLYDYIQSKTATVKPTKESFNSVTESFLSGALDSDELQYKLENVLASDEDIFYNRKKFKNGETNLCFIVGLSGSGKSSMAATMARGAHNVEHYRLDNIVENKSKGRDEEYYEKMGDMAIAFFSGPGRRYYVNDAEIESKLNLSKDKYIEKITNAFVDFAVSYARSHDDTKFIIEGVQLHRYIDPSRFRDYAVCIKGTSIAKSMYQAGKRDNDFASKIKKTFQYAGDDLKLNKWKHMYKNLADTDEEDGFSDEEEYDEHFVLPSDNDELLHMEAYQRYIESCIENEDALQKFFASHTSSISESSIMLEAESLQNKVRNRFDIVINFIARIADRFTKAMEKIVLSQKGYLEKYQNVILNTRWSDDMEYAYQGDYKEAINRCLNFDMPQFNYEVYAPFLREDGYDKLIERFTAGHNFKFDGNNQNLAEQFKNYFLALDRGESKGKFSQLEPKAIYSFCHDQYNDLIGKIKKDQEILKRSQTAFMQAARNAEREAAQNKQGQEQPTTNTAANPNTNTAGSGGTTPVKTTGGTQPVQAVQASARIDEFFKPTEHPEMWHETANPTADTPKPDTNLQISNTNQTKVDKEGNLQNKSGKTTNSTDDEDLTNMMTKWIKVCQAFTTGKYTAIQKISKDYMDIIRAHVKAHTSKDAKVDSTQPNKKEKTEEAPAPNV